MGRDYRPKTVPCKTVFLAVRRKHDMRTGLFLPVKNHENGRRVRTAASNQDRTRGANRAHCVDHLTSTKLPYRTNIHEVGMGEWLADHSFC